MPQTGATRHQKFLKSEKSKTKLKSKKKDLPKGTNVTKTNFKIKKIVLKEQLKKHGANEALSTKKLNIKELLSRLNHFNTKSRTEALDGLREIICNYADTLNLNLGHIILGVTPLVLNVEKVVRHESLKVLHLVLSNTTPEKVEPFFDIMSTYLRSAMTHIDVRIQEDSLLFLDLLLTCAPERVVMDIHKILPNFLDMISKLRVDSKPGRTLTVNLSSQITTVRWRVKVLHRLKDYLKKYVQYKPSHHSNKATDCIIRYFEETKSNNQLIFNPSYTSVCHVSCFAPKSYQDTTSLDEVDKFKQYVTTLTPLLFETWLEVAPKTSSDISIETVVNKDTAFLLKRTLEVISIMFYLMDDQSSNVKQHFSQKYGQQFNQHFIQSFPYVTNIRTKQKKIDNNSVFEDVITDPKLIAENLEICHLYVKFNPNVNVKNQSTEIKSVLNYIEKTLSSSISEDIRNMLMSILETLFSSQIGWFKTYSIMESLFHKIINEYFKKELCSLFKQQIFGVLCKIALNESLKQFHNTDIFNSWFKTLPNILLEESVSEDTINILHMFSVKNNAAFNEIMKPNLLKIINHLPLITISGGSDANYYRLFSVLYWIKAWDNESLNLLEQQLLNNEYKSDHGKYIFDTLRLRVGGML